MFKLLNQPYPIEEPASRSWIRAALIGLFVGLFLLTFQPFGTDQWQTPYKPWKLLGFGVVSFVVTAFHFLVWPRLFPTVFSEVRWTVGKAIAFIFTNILLIAVANWLYLSWLVDKPAGNWGYLILITFLVGIFPTAGAVVAGYIVRLRRYARQAAELPVHPAPETFTNRQPAAQPDPIESSLLTLTADNGKDTLTLPVADLLFIESSDNYCTVNYLKKGQPTKPLLRSSLSRLEEQVSAAHVVRCHRSFLVNLDRVERVTGNAQGYKLHLLSGQFVVPVARKYNDTLVAELKAL